PAALFALTRQRMEQPTPRVALGQALRGIASAAADISDGLIGDLGHILKASHVGARIDADAAVALIAATGHPQAPTRDWTPTQLRSYALAGGDDYELVF